MPSALNRSRVAVFIPLPLVSSSAPPTRAPKTGRLQTDTPPPVIVWRNCRGQTPSWRPTVPFRDAENGWCGLYRKSAK